LLTRSDFPLPLLGMVHLANSVTQHRAIRLGEALDVRAWAQDLRPHRSGPQVDLVTEVTVGEEVVWTGTSTYLAKGTPPGGANDPSAAHAWTEDDGSKPRVADEGAVLGEVGRDAPLCRDASGQEPFVPPVPTGRW